MEFFKKWDCVLLISVFSVPGTQATLGTQTTNQFKKKKKKKEHEQNYPPMEQTVSLWGHLQKRLEARWSGGKDKEDDSYRPTRTELLNL